MRMSPFVHQLNIFFSRLLKIVRTQWLFDLKKYVRHLFTSIKLVKTILSSYSSCIDNLGIFNDIGS